MSRPPDPDFDPRIADWLEGDPDMAPPELARTVDVALPSIAQRQALRLPWRILPMHRLALVGATLVTVAVIGALALSLNLRPPSPQVASSAASSPALSSSSAPAPTTNPAAAYQSARNAICTAATTADAPLRARYDRLWTTGLTAVQRADAVAALRAFVTLNDRVNAQLDALTPPPDLRHDHVADVTHREDISTLIVHELSLIDEGKLVDAQAVDVATNSIADEASAYESHNGLEPCP